MWTTVIVSYADTSCNVEKQGRNTENQRSELQI